MNDKMVKNLTIVLVAMVAVYGFMRWQQNQSFEPEKPKGFNFSSITNKNTTSIIVKSKDAKYTLNKFSDKWTLDKLEVDQASIDAIFNDLKTAEVQQVAATTPGKLALLEVDDIKGKGITFVTDKKEHTFIIGKSGPDGTSFYVRLPKENKAYVASGNLAGSFTKKASDWYSKQVLSLTAENISKVEVSTAGSSFVLNKDKKQWFITENDAKEKSDTNKTTGFISSLSALTATSVETKKINFNGAETIKIYGKKNALLATLSLKPKNKKEFYLMSDKKKDFTYILDEFSAKNIRKKSKELK